MTREELRAVLDSVTVVDAQPPARYGQRHLPGALNLVAEDSEEHVTGALPDAAAPVVVYSTDADCRRAPELAARLQALGYADVRTTPGASRTGSRPGWRSSARGRSHSSCQTSRWARPPFSSRGSRVPASTSRSS